MEREQLYGKIPDELLGAFYCYIKDNMDKGTHVELMNNEVELIKTEAEKRQITVKKLQNLGTEFIKNEMELVRKSL